MVHEWGSYAKGSRDPTTQTNTPKSMEEVATKVMKANKAAMLFQTMAIMNLNMGNLTLEVNILENRLVTREKEKVVLHEELDKERAFQKGYKHNVEILRKNMANVEQKHKVLIKKLQGENEELKGITIEFKAKG